MIEQYFVATIGEGPTEIELTPGGSAKRVTNDNKDEFIKLKCHFAAYKATESQLEALCQGFYKVFPKSWIQFLTPDELESQMCGQNKIDLEDWRENTETKGFFWKSITLYRFWDIMGTYN